MDMGLPYTPLIESLEEQVGLGLFTAWSCAHRSGAISAFYADEAYPRDWLLDQNSQLHPHQKAFRSWMPAFDLASLTKPLLANAWLRHTLGPDSLLWTGSPLASLIEPRSEEGQEIKTWAEGNSWLTLAHLLNHTSGLQAWTWFGRALWHFTPHGPSGNARSINRTANLQNDSDGQFARTAQRDLTAHILKLPLQKPEAESATVYSDLNYYLLARVIENLAVSRFPGWKGILEELNDLWKTEFWHTSLDPERSQQAVPFFPYVHSQVVAHLYESRKLNNHAGEFGAAHDTNANILATEFRSACAAFLMVSSHAGMFGSVLDVAKVADFFVASQNEFSELVIPKNIRSNRFDWGLDTPSNEQSTAGLNHWPLAKGKKIFGHLGYTGTSLWMADDGQYQALLTNRTASRTVIGAATVPRILVFQNNSGDEPHCWIRRQDTKKAAQWQSVHWQDAFALSFEYSKGMTRYWDRNSIRKPPDLAAVRRSTGRYLWSN
ncbi:class C beta-lactamase-related serine hydrolase [bacterium]|nr:class C beta-lactamase-related serine hydrolase [bacterium]